ncbi:MAG: hypothetical protein ATN35_01240 [Epulopiscium sp. Nele67-Bin004]|nr:MAG: hypothetical protein ATN35_01240 [Epulopiscium sp. Nele67-Bin004]
MWITKLALDRPVSSALSVVLMIVFGFVSLFSMRMSYMPSMSMPVYVISTVYVGANADVIQSELTDPITETAENITGFQYSMTTSISNVSFVALYFDFGIDLNQTYIDMKAAIDRLKLPDDAEIPIIMQIVDDGASVMEISIQSLEGADELVFVRDIIEPKINTILGVAEINTYGGTEQYVDVVLDESAMDQYGVSMFMVANAMQNANYTMPLGSISQGNLNLNMVASTLPENLYDILNIPITTMFGNTILVRDVANVQFMPKYPTSFSRVNGEDNITVSIRATQDADIPTVTNAIKAELDQISAMYSDMKIEVVQNTTDDIYTTLLSVAGTLAVAVVLCMFVLYIFLGDFKASLIVGSSIPTSLLITLMMMGASGFEMNMITSSALIICIGLMVDNSIVVLESMFKCKTPENTHYEAALEGTRTVGMSVIASTITTIVVYLPIAVLEGLAGQLFKALGFTIVYALIASLAIAMSIVPLVYVKLAPNEKTTAPLNKFMTKAENSYEPRIRRVLNRKFTAVGLAIASLGVTAYLISYIPVQTLPIIDQGIIYVDIDFRAGTDIYYVDDAIAPFEQKVATDSRIDNYTITIEEGSASLIMYAVDGYSSDDIALDYEKFFATAHNMDANISFADVTGMPRQMPHATLSVFGIDYDMVQAEAIRIQAEMAQIPGVTRVTSSVGAAGTQARLNIDPLTAAYYGLGVSDIAQIVYSVNNGIDVGTLNMYGSDYDITITYPEGSYDDVTKLMEYQFDTNKGTITLGDVVDIVFEDTEQAINRTGGNFYIDLKAFTEDQYLAYVEGEVAKIIDSMPESVYVGATEIMVVDVLDGEIDVIAEAVVIGIFLVFIVMAMQFESIRFSLMVMISVVFSSIGAFGLLAATGLELSLIALVGLMMLSGIVVNSGILFVDTTNQLKQEMPLDDALVLSGKMRMRPIFMTTATTILSMVPLALGTSEGSQMLQGMGVVIIGGLLTSTALVLLLMPTFYLILNKKTKETPPELNLGTE